MYIMKGTNYMYLMSHRNQKPRVCMSTKCLITYRLFRYYYEAELIQKLIRDARNTHTKASNLTFMYIDMLCNNLSFNLQNVPKRT